MEPTKVMGSSMFYGNCGNYIPHQAESPMNLKLKTKKLKTIVYGGVPCGGRGT